MTNPSPARTTTSAPVDVIVWGLGTGRHLVRFVRNRKRVRVLALDLDAGDATAVEARLSARPALLAAWKRGQLEIVTGPPEQLARSFAAAEGAPVHVHEPALDAAPPSHRRLAATIERISSERASARRHAGRMRANLRANLPTIAASPPMSALAGAARGRAVIVVAAGPSLSRFLPLLERAARTAPTVVVDTALPVCARAGVRVDVAVCVDPHPETTAHFEGVEPDSVLAYQPFVPPEILRRYARRCVAAPRGDAFWERVAPLLGIPLVDVVGTVLLYALQIAEVCRPDAVLLVGADLALVGGLSHARGCAHARRIDGAPTTTLRADGTRVPTTFALRRFQAAVEAHLARTPIRHFALDGGGATLEGATMIDERTADDLVTRLAASNGRSDFAAHVATPPTDPDARRAILEARLAEFDSVP